MPKRGKKAGDGDKVKNSGFQRRRPAQDGSFEDEAGPAHPIDQDKVHADENEALEMDLEQGELLREYESEEEDNPSVVNVNQSNQQVINMIRKLKDAQSDLTHRLTELSQQPG